MEKDRRFLEAMKGVAGENFRAAELIEFLEKRGRHVNMVEGASQPGVFQAFNTTLINWKSKDVGICQIPEGVQKYFLGDNLVKYIILRENSKNASVIAHFIFYTANPCSDFLLGLAGLHAVCLTNATIKQNYLPSELIEQMKIKAEADTLIAELCDAMLNNGVMSVMDSLRLSCFMQESVIAQAASHIRGLLAEHDGRRYSLLEESAAATLASNVVLGAMLFRIYSLS